MNAAETIIAATTRLLQEAECCRTQQQGDRLRTIARQIRRAIHSVFEADDKATKPAKTPRQVLVMGDENFDWKPPPPAKKPPPYYG